MHSQARTPAVHPHVIQQALFDPRLRFGNRQTPHIEPRQQVEINLAVGTDDPGRARGWFAQKPTRSCCCPNPPRLLRAVKPRSISWRRQCRWYLRQSSIVPEKFFVTVPGSQRPGDAPSTHAGGQFFFTSIHIQVSNWENRDWCALDLLIHPKKFENI